MLSEYFERDDDCDTGKLWLFMDNDVNSAGDSSWFAPEICLADMRGKPLVKTELYGDHNSDSQRFMYRCARIIPLLSATFTSMNIHHRFHYII